MNLKLLMMKKITLLMLFMLLYISNITLAQPDKPKVKDDPIGRAIYEYEILKNPVTGKIPDNVRQKELGFAKTLKSKKSFKAGDWSHRGPFNVGGRTRALAVDVNNENIILAAGVSGGMWRSIDGGQSWVKTTNNSQLHSVTSIVQDIRVGQTNTWYYTTGELSGNSAAGSGAPYRGDGVFKSADNGQSWTKLSATGDDVPQTFDRFFNYCWTVKVNEVNGDVYVATYAKIYRSQDGGTTWDVVLSGGTVGNYGNYSDIEISTTGVCYATFSNNDENEGVFRSTDGTTWTNITPATFPTSLKRIVLDIAPSNENILYFLANTPGEGLNDHSLWKYEYLTGDGAGANGSWVNRSDSLPADGGHTGDFDSQGSYDLIVKIKPDDENFVIIGGVNLNRSTDGFATTANTSWIGGYTTSNTSYAVYPNHHPDQHSLLFMASDPNIVIMGSDGGLHKTTDITSNLTTEEPVSWTVLNNGYITTQSYAIAIDNENYYDYKLMSGFQDNGTWITTEESGTVDWREQGSGDGCYCDFGRKGFARYSSSQKGRVYGDFYKTSGTYDYWTRVDPGSGSLFVNPFVLDPNNTNVMYYLGGNKIYRNTNLEEIPKRSQTPATKNWTGLENSVVASTITALTISTETANILYYGTSDGKIYKMINSIVGDPDPIDISGNDFPSGNIGSVLVNPTDTSELVVTFTNYEVVSIWHSSDGGISWESISGNLEENIDGTGNGPSVRWISMLKMAGDDPIYFVGTSTGLYSTTTLDGNSTVWTQEGASVIGNVVVTMIKTREDGHVAVGTHGNGMYSANYTSTTINPPVLISAKTDEAETETNKIELTFDKDMVSPAGKHLFFTVDDGIDNPTVQALYKAGDPTSYVLTLENNVTSVENVIVSYQPGNIKSIDGGILKAFSDQNVSNIVNVEEIESAKNIKIYPNPNSGVFNLEIQKEKPSNFIIAIYNMQGQIVYFSKQDNTTNLTRSIDLQKHAKGIYNLEIVENGKASNHKVLIK